MMQALREMAVAAAFVVLPHRPRDPAVRQDRAVLKILPFAWNRRRLLHRPRAPAVRQDRAVLKILPFACHRLVFLIYFEQNL
jgi:hypothetical protein